MLFSSKGNLDKNTFKNLWENIPPENEFSINVDNIKYNFRGEDNLKSILKANDIYFIASKDITDSK